VVDRHVGVAGKDVLAKKLDAQI